LGVGVLDDRVLAAAGFTVIADDRADDPGSTTGEEGGAVGQADADGEERAAHDEHHIPDNLVAHGRPILPRRRSTADGARNPSPRRGGAA
jgi:hypothetical protein